MYAVIAQIFNSTAELAIPTGTPANEANPKFETQPLTAKMKTRKSSNYLITLHFFLCFSLIKSLCFITSKGSFLVSSIFVSLNSRLTFYFVIFVFKVLIYYMVILFIVIKRK